jgi:hypothetical protein
MKKMALPQTNPETVTEAFTTPETSKTAGHKHISSDFGEKRHLSQGDIEENGDESLERMAQKIIQATERRKPPRLSPSHFNEPLLTKSELVKWYHHAEKVNISPRAYGDIDSPRAIRKIRTVIHPPIWKPTGKPRLNAIGKRDISAIVPSLRGSYLPSIGAEAKHRSFFI